jgi:hypothetical protein
MANSAHLLKEAIDDWRRKSLEAYRARPEQILMDANSAAKVAADHVSRWLLELIQNADDAGADHVKVRLTASAVYFADNGLGLQAKAISSISALYLSDKPAQAIGRKGLGFKAVYCLSREPAIFSKGEGLYFNEAEARRELAAHKFTGLEKIPYTWLPFWLERQREEEIDPELKRLCNFTTVIRLRLSDVTKDSAAVAEARSLQAHTLLTFRKLRRVEFETDTDAWHIAVEDATGGNWKVNNAGTTQQWRLLSRMETTPEAILGELSDPEDRDRCRQVSLLVASLLDEEGTPVRFKPPPYLHVFYPTEIKAPLDVMMHAEFVTKSDRTGIVPIAGSRFNEWLAGCLAKSMVAHAQAAFSQTRPEAGLMLLKPTPEAWSEGSITQALWQRIVSVAKVELRIPNSDGELAVGVADALVFAQDFPGRTAARRIVQQSNSSRGLVHEGIENYPEAIDVLRLLGGTVVNAAQVATSIEAALTSAPEALLWDMVEWLAAWLNQPKSMQGDDALIARLRGLKVIPLENGEKTSLTDLQKVGISWRDGSWDKGLPSWLPLKFIAPWFRVRLAGLVAESEVMRLLRAAGLKDPSKKLLLEVCGQAITLYWLQPDEPADRFLNFLWAGDFELGPDEARLVGRCPVRAMVDGREQWVPASEVYFGGEWENGILEEVYHGVSGIKWVVVPPGDKAAWREFFGNLGVASRPRLMEDSSERGRSMEQRRVCQIVRFWPAEVRASLRFDGLDPTQMTDAAFTSLLGVLARDWFHYAPKRSSRTVGKIGRSWVPGDYDALWWAQIKSRLAPCLADGPTNTLDQAWLPEENIRPELRPLLPVLDKAAFGADWPGVRDWLRNQGIVRRALTELTYSDWREILGERLPRRYPASAGKESYLAAARCYEAALQAWSEKAESGGATLQIRLLARRGEAFDYVNPSEIWLSDEASLADAFAGEVWQIAFVQAHQSLAARWLGLHRLSQRESHPNWTAATGEVDAEWTRRLQEVAPYLLAKRSNDAPAQRPQFLAKLKAASVRRAEQLIEEVCLPRIGVAKSIPRRWALADTTILLADGQDESNLGEAVASLLDRETDAHLFEILFRCETPQERRDRLVQSGVPQDVIDSCLSEFAAPMMLPESPSISSNDNSVAAEKPSRSTGGSPAEPAKPPPPVSMPAQWPLKSPENGWETRRGEAHPVSHSKDTTGGGSTAGPGGGASLTQTEKDEIEDAGRAFVTAELENRGWEITSMSRSNPGFDLEARRGSDKLLVEVKAHRQQASIIELTKAEWEKYLESRKPNADFAWQLWNVENLALGTSKTTLTTYNNLPEAALVASAYRVDLKLCEAQKV